MSYRALATVLALCLGTTLCVHRAGAKPPGVKEAPKPVPPPAGPPPAAVPKVEAKAELKMADGKKVGEATLTETKMGVLISATLENLPPGVHAFHIHETGKCEAPFKTAGGHFNPEGAKHGMMSEMGKHAGDLPNIHVPDGGKLSIETLAHDVTLKPGQKNSLFDADGSALVIHAKADDNLGDPAGNAGDRIACGVIAK